MIDLTEFTTKPNKPDITPLLDVVFILLIFFVVSSVFTVQGVKMDLPEATAAMPLSGRSHTIRIMQDNTLRFDNAAISARELTFRLKTIQDRAQPLDRIVLECSPLAQVRTFIMTADMVKSAGFEDLIIATTHPGESERF